MLEETIQVIARVTARPEHLGEVRRLLAGLVAPTRAEPGCLRYELWQGRENPAEFVFVEVWANQAALDAHLASAHINAVSLEGLVVAPEEVTFFRHV